MAFGLSLVLSALPQTTPVHAQSVTGAGTIPVRNSQGQGLPQGNFTVAASTVPATGLPTGVVRVRLPGFAEATADVNLLLVQGNTALAGGPIRAGSTLDPSFTFLYLIVVDNGRPSHGTPPDLSVAIITTSDVTPIAAAFLDFFIQFVGPVSNGNYTVKP
jgi:hypothetical protein